MKTIEINGVKYSKASEVAKDFGYTSDYIGQLCRGKKIDATLVGRTWYVNKDSLKKHKSGRYRSTQKKTAEQVKSTIKARSADSDHGHGKEVHMHVHSYESDSHELFPSVAHTTKVSASRTPLTHIHHGADNTVSVRSESKKVQYKAVKEEQEDVFFKGTLAVEDLDEREQKKIVAENQPVQPRRISVTSVEEQVVTEAVSRVHDNDTHIMIQQNVRSRKSPVLIILSTVVVSLFIIAVTLSLESNLVVTDTISKHTLGLDFTDLLRSLRNALK